MLMRLAALSVIVMTSTVPVLAQTSGTTTLPGIAPATSPDRSAVTPPPGVADPMATNSTTGTVDHEDHCQPPGTPSNTNPSAEVPTLPRPEPACN